MYQRNRNLFSLLAVLLTAGLLVGVGGLFLLLADQFDGGTKVISGGPTLTADERTNDSADGLAIAQDSPDSSAVAVLTDSVDSQGWPGAMTTIGSHDATVLSVAAVADGSWIASGSYDNTVKLWRKDDTDYEKVLAHNGRVNALAFTPDGRRLLTGSGAGNLRLWDTRSGNLLSTLQGKSGRITSVAIDDAGSQVATGSGNGTLTIWQLSASNQLTNPKVLTPVGPQINTLRFHPTDSNKVVAGDHDGIIQVWDIKQALAVQTLIDDADRIIGIDITADGKYVASGSYDRTIRIWNLETDERVQTLVGHDFVVADVAFSPDGELLASGSYDESIKVWNWSKAEMSCTLTGHSGFVYSVDFTDAGTALLSGAYDGTVRAWNLGIDQNEACLVR